MIEAFNRGLKITEEIYSGKSNWQKLFDAPNFFSLYKHFIVLIASSATAEDQLEWYGLIESKIRHLIGQLERNQYIQLPHIWPTSYPPVNPPPDKVHCTQWFIGLIFAKSKDNVNIDLTYDIVSFRNAVNFSAENLKIFKEGMELDALYVRKKDLKHYLPPHVLGPNKRDSDGDGEIRKRKRSSTSMSEDTTPKKNRKNDEESANNDTSLNGGIDSDTSSVGFNSSQASERSCLLVDDESSFSAPEGPTTGKEAASTTTAASVTTASTLSTSTGLSTGALEVPF
jgi:poly(A) polymerase